MSHHRCTVLLQERCLDCVRVAALGKALELAHEVLIDGRMVVLRIQDELLGLVCNLLRGVQLGLQWPKPIASVSSPCGQLFYSSKNIHLQVRGSLFVAGDQCVDALGSPVTP